MQAVRLFQWEGLLLRMCCCLMLTTCCCCLQGLVEKHSGPKGGRKITAAGQRDLDLIAGSVATGSQAPEDEEVDED